MRPLRIFVSSPMDVSAERTVAKRVIERLALEYAYHFKISPVMSELEPLVATGIPQDHITPPSETDIVVTLLWSRLGTALPADPRYAIDEEGRRPTGTEWEFFDAMRANKLTGTPELLVYRKTERITTNLDDEAVVLENLRQKKELERFLEHWFRSADGSWKAWCHSFEREDELEYLLDTHLRKLIEGRIALDPQTDDRATSKVIEGNPFRGLKSFDIEDAPLFFGRTRALNELRDVLEAQNARRSGFVLVTGGSGSGKSSLVKAGLLADLQNPHRIGRVAKVRHAILRPTDQNGQVMLAVAEALLKPTAFPELTPVGWTATELARVAVEDPQRLVEALRHAASVIARGNGLRDPSDVRLCLVVDQLEELFTAGIPEPMIGEFTRLVTLLARSEIVWVVATLRSDFYHRLDDTPDLLLLAERGSYRLKAPLPTELGQMIRKPAQLAGLRFQKHPESGVGLDAVLQDDAVSDPTALPLLEFALTELWTQRAPDGLLTFEAYERMGRITGAIAERAEALIATLTPGSQQHLAATLRALITVSRADTAPTAATVQRSRIATTLERAEILDRLIDARLIVTDDLENRGDPKCRLAHEKLIETWPRLRKLAEADRTFLESRGRLRAAAETWEARQRNRDLLLPAGTQLGEGAQLLAHRRDELDDLTIGFVEASVKADRDARSRGIRRARALAATFGSLAVVALGFAGWALYNDFELIKKEREARAAADRAEKGYELALKTAGALGRSVGTSGANIEGMLGQAEKFLEESSGADRNSVGGTAPIAAQIERAELVLGFAGTSERTGNVQQMRDRMFHARAILEPICGGTDTSNTSCRMLLAESYVVEGNYERRGGNLTQAIRAYRIALDLYPPSTDSQQGSARPLLMRARILAAAARAETLNASDQDAVKTSEACIATVRQVQTLAPNATDLPLVAADCHVQRGHALLKLTPARGEEASREADAALAVVAQGPTAAATDVGGAERRALAHELAATVAYRAKRPEEAARSLAEAVRVLDGVARSNPQNEDLSWLLQDLMRQLVDVHVELGRTDLASAMAEARIGLAETRQMGAQAHRWRRVLLDSLRRLADIYSERRPRDAQAVVERELALWRTVHPLPTDKPGTYPPAVLHAMGRAGKLALDLKDGARAYDLVRELIEHASRGRALELAAKPQSADGYSLLDAHLERGFDRLSRITSESLPPARRVAVLKDVVARLEQQVIAEPRVIRFRFARGRALHQLAIAYQESGALPLAVETFERGSAAGHKSSTLVLRRWYLEGHATIKPDGDKARQLEDLARRQDRLGYFSFEVEDLVTKRVSRETIYLEEEGSGVLPLADEEYRLRKYENKVLTAESRKIIADVYAYVAKNKTTMHLVLQQARNRSSDPVVPATRLKPVFEAVEADLKAKQWANAKRKLDDARSKLSAITTEPLHTALTERAALAHHFVRVATGAQADKSAALAAEARRSAAALRHQVLGLQSSGSSPRLAHAADLETFAALANAIGDADGAIAYYEQAITLRLGVRTDDPKNSDCACNIAYDYTQISNIEKGRGQLARAAAAMQRALQIREELDTLEPGSGWYASVAKTATDLSDLYSDLGSPQLALHFARHTLDRSAEIAAKPSAESEERLKHAERLENTARAMSQVAWNTLQSKRAEGEQLYRQAIETFEQANQIRTSVLTVDPTNDSCRCNVASNYWRIAEAYKALGQPAEFRKSIEQRVKTNRQLVAEHPRESQWRYNLAIALDDLNDAIQGNTAESRQQRSANSIEAAALLEDLKAQKPLSNEGARRLHGVYFNLSYNQIFMGDYAGAVAAADKAVATASDDFGRVWPLGNKAHALMLLDRRDEALALYRAHADKTARNRSWAADVLDDFRQLQSAGISHPMMSEVEELLKPSAAK